MKKLKENNSRWIKSLIKEDTSVKDVLLNLNNTSLKISLVVDDKKKLIGTVSDGDIRRGFLNGMDLNSPIKEIINRDPLTVSKSATYEYSVSLMKNLKFYQIPIIDKNRKVIGIHLIDESFPVKELDNVMLIMAGGEGKRMLPHTENTPKPMLKVAGKPILEHIIARAKKQGFSKFFISIHFQSEIIKNYFGNGDKWSVKIKYIEENKPLGTAGAIALIDPFPNKNFVVMNGDLITSVQFDDMLNFHEFHKAVASMSVKSYQWENPFGVVNTEGINITSFEEKPKLDYKINAGVYVFSPEIKKVLNSYEKCDMPEIFRRLQSVKKQIIAYLIYENWFDVGNPEDLVKVNNYYRK